MKTLNRPEYLAALKSAMTQYEIVAPNYHRLARLLPHLTPEQIACVISAPAPTLLALPPVLVRGSFHVAQFCPADSRRSAPAFRVISPSSQTHDQFGRSGQYYDEALRYANRHWSSELVPQSWSHVQTVYLEDPQELVNLLGGNVPRVKHVIWVGLKSHAILSRFRSIEEWERTIAIASLDPAEGSEIEGGQGCLTSFNCARCGGGLAYDMCLGCRRRLYDNSRVSWATPLPPKLVQLLEDAGHEFESKAA